MKKMYSMTVFIIFLVAICFACSPGLSEPEVDIRRTWEYTMIEEGGNTYDTGTITFEGTPARGTYEQINIYKVDYHGDYELRGDMIALTGDENWDGTVEDAAHMRGTWKHDGGVKGTWSAVKVEMP